MVLHTAWDAQPLMMVNFHGKYLFKARLHSEKRLSDDAIYSKYQLSPIKVGTSHFCGGSVLSATKVASAAHCFQNSFNVVAGSVDNQGGQTRVGDNFLQHPAYDSQNILNDFAVVTTASGFNFNDYLQPIPLVAPSNNRTGSFLRFESVLSDSDCFSF